MNRLANQDGSTSNDCTWKFAVPTTTMAEVNQMFRLEGETRATANDGWSGDERNSASRQRGIETRLLGKAAYDRSKNRFVQFELLGFGTRWGIKTHFEHFDSGPAPVGFLFALGGTSPSERLAPYILGKYGWNK